MSEEIEFEGWPDLPPTRIVGLEALHALRGRIIYAVQHHCERRYQGFRVGKTVGLAEATVFPWVAGPILVESLVHDRRFAYAQFDPAQQSIETLRRSIAEGTLLLTENGDWGNDLRPQLTMIDLAAYNVQGRSVLSPCNAMFTSQKDAELWAVQVTLSMSEPMRDELRSKRLRYRVINNRSAVKASVRFYEKR